MTVYPNPARDIVHILSPIKKGTSVECSIYDVAGKLVNTLYKGIWIQDGFNFVWNGKDSNGENVKSGVYFIRLNTSTLKGCVKIVIAD